ncbi:MAG: formylglycine-generating enzyme family protein [Polyangiaceae bacterium]|nr:formylglycine-generating enzyme family protein [Polyangiaceae bacterium]
MHEKILRATGPTRRGGDLRLWATLFPLGYFCALGACGPSTVVSGETVVVIDTDLPVPDVVEALRLDVYAEDGTWLSARDVDMGEPSQWPLSFGIAASDDHPGRVLVRARAYPKGRLRNYAGALRPAPPEPFREEPLPSTLAAVCASMPELPVGGTAALRFGDLPLTTPRADGGCATEAGAFPTRAGAAAARVRIETAGDYRFEVVSEVPVGTFFPLFLRSDCTDASSELVCARGYRETSNAPVSVLQTHLEAGTYALLTTHFIPDQSASLVVRASLLGASPEDAGADAGEVKVAPPPPAAVWPRLLRDGRDDTPPTEPKEEVTSEAFVFVDVVPHAVRHARLVVGGDCVGRAAHVPAKDQRRLDVAGIVACEAGRMTSPHVLSSAPGAAEPKAASVLGSFAQGKPCAASRPGRICAPGGMMVMGSELFGGIGDGATTPERVVRLPTFYVDQDELSVGEYRTALASGFALPPGVGKAAYVQPTLEPFDPRSDKAANLCTYTEAPAGRDDFPLNCVTWPAARDLCRHRGGELPTEASWEYVARKAGRTRAALYPWGNGDPTCADAIFDRLHHDGAGACAPKTADEGPQPRPVVTGDVTPLGVRNMAGGQAEWTLDAYAAYTDPCWLAAPTDAPRCALAFAPLRAGRGTHFASPSPLLAAPLRRFDYAMSVSPLNGVRCVYEQP